MNALLGASEKLVKISGFPMYDVSSKGTVYSYYTGTRTPLCASPDKDGYLLVSLCNRGKKCTRGVHRLVCQAFCGPRPGSGNKWHVAHSDGNITNNTAGNLRWATARENKADSRRHGTIAEGTRNGNSKLTKAAVAAIRSATGKYANIAKQFEVGTSTIGRIKRGEIWKHVS